MGRIKIHEIKKTSFDLISAYPGKFTDDFKSNKEVLSGLNIATSKKVRNKIAGYVTKIAKRRK